nr:3-dehydroquinate synthase [Gemmatimonadaceae bacterium]
LLAMVDAAIGGKVAVDVPAGKNLVGAFHPPLAVVADLDVLATLPARERAQGLAEALKHGVIADAAYWAAVTAALPWPADAAALERLVRGSACIKAAVVARDPLERGERAILNFGHTIAHAIERVVAFDMAHGDAVAMGMVVEADVATRLGLCDGTVSAALHDALPRAGLPTTVPASLDVEAILAATAGDKKRAGGTVRWALPAALGRMARDADGRWGHAVPDDVARAALLAARA